MSKREQYDVDKAQSRINEVRERNNLPAVDLTSDNPFNVGKYVPPNEKTDKRCTDNEDTNDNDSSR
jgi:hypothetical protein